LTGHVFPRVLDRELPTAVSAEGVWITDADGRRYLDAAGGAIVTNLPQGDADVLLAMSEQATRAAYVHGTAFTTDALEIYADELAEVLPMDDPRVYPVSGGSEAVETALKLARAYHLARGDASRHKIVARRGSYHGNTRGALDASGREPLRRPYLPWLGQTVHVSAPYEYRCELPDHPTGCGARLAEELDRTIETEGPSSVAAFIAEPIVGATLGAAVPPPDYWPAVADVCRNHGVLVIADEVMTGFGRTGAWFGVDHWSVRPDILVAGKGASSGYWPLGLTVASGEVFEPVRQRGFVHGFTYSHSAVGAAVGRAVLRRLRDDALVDRSRDVGFAIKEGLRDALVDCLIVGDVRGMGLMIAVELVRDRATKAPFPRSDRVTERVLEAARERELLLYPSTGCADGVDGDLVMIGPPFTISEEESDTLVERMTDAIESVRASAPASAR
jgi:adenosylmethionine-8-amino-7-oxononanoate aminotransferase